jgi:hypothetical protein
LRVIDLYTHASPIAIDATGKNRLIDRSLLPQYVAVQYTHGVISMDGNRSTVGGPLDRPIDKDLAIC